MTITFLEELELRHANILKKFDTHIIRRRGGKNYTLKHLIEEKQKERTAR